MKNTILFILFIFGLSIQSVIAQEDDKREFILKGNEFFEKAEYTKAIIEYRAALAYTEEQDSIFDLIEISQTCLSFREQADSLFTEHKYLISDFFYEEVYKRNKNDTS